MRRHLILTSFFILSYFCLQAQSKWYFAPSVGQAIISDAGHFYTDLTIGHYLGEKPFRIDVWGSYIFASDNNVYSVSALFTGELNIGKWLSNASIGAGAQKNELRNNVDFIIPIRSNFGYCLTNHLILGVAISNSLNISDYKKGSPFYCGFFIGLRL